MTNIYEKNLRYLKRASSEIYNMIIEGKPIYELEVIDFEKTDNAIILKNDKKCYLHSIYNQNLEYEKMLSLVNENTKTLIIFGIGYGNIFKYIKNLNLQIEHIIIIEPSLQIFKKFLHAIKIESLTKYITKISFIINQTPEATAESIEQIISESINTHIQFVYSITYRTIFKEYFEIMSKHIVNIIRGIKMNTLTNFINTYPLLVNVTKNLKIEGYSVLELSELLKNNPVIMVSAGPSINKNIHILEKAKEKAIVIAVGTAIEILEQNNITPHFRAAFSPTLDLTIFKKLKNYEVPLIYMNNLYHDILPEYIGPKFRLLSHSDVYSKYVYNKLGIENKTVISELSIANIIFEYLCSIHCKEIILIGQDLAYQGNKMYAEGAINNIEVTENTEGLIKELNTEGKTVFTDYKFKGMRDSLVRSIKRYNRDKKTVINTSEGGLAIPNTTYVKLADKLKSMNNLDYIDIEIQKIIENENKKERYFEEIIREMYDIKKQVNEIKKIANKRIELIRKVVEMKELGISKNDILKEYEKINKLELEMLKIDFYNEVVKYQLQGNYNTVIAAFKYDGIDQSKQIEALESILMRVGVELMSYFEIFEALMSEFEIEFEQFGLLEKKESAIDDKK